MFTTVSEVLIATLFFCDYCPDIKLYVSYSQISHQNDCIPAFHPERRIGPAVEY